MDQVQPHRNEKIGKKDGGIANHNRVGCGSSDTLSPTARVHPFKATYGDDQNPEEKRFDQPDKKIEIMHVIFNRIIVAIRCHLKKVYRNQISPNYPHHHTKNG
jgi:hypothetical protein